MRRRALPLMVTLIAAALAAWRRSQLRAAAALRGAPAAGSVPEATAGGPQEAPGLLAAGPTGDRAVEPSDHAEIAGPTVDHEIKPDPRVEGETRPPALHNEPPALHNEPPALHDPPAVPDLLPRPRPHSPFRSVAWHLLDGDPAPEATELRIGFSLMGRYERLARIDVRETASQVFVTVVARLDPPAGGWFAYGEAQQATVVLEAPLGDRALVPSPPDEPAPAAPAG
jgi:hypothetical protein